MNISFLSHIDVFLSLIFPFFSKSIVFVMLQVFSNEFYSV